MRTVVASYVGLTAVLAGLLAAVVFIQMVTRHVRAPRRRWVMSSQAPSGRVQAPRSRNVAR
jgi:hypothetical protein